MNQIPISSENIVQSSLGSTLDDCIDYFEMESQRREGQLDEPTQLQQAHDGLLSKIQSLKKDKPDQIDPIHKNHTTSALEEAVFSRRIDETEQDSHDTSHFFTQDPDYSHTLDKILREIEQPSQIIDPHVLLSLSYEAFTNYRFRFDLYQS